MEPVLVVGAAIATGLGLVFGLLAYQRCPHCGHIVRRASQGWRRCGSCGRQYLWDIIHKTISFSNY